MTTKNIVTTHSAYGRFINVELPPVEPVKTNWTPTSINVSIRINSKEAA